MTTHAEGSDRALAALALVEAINDTRPDAVRTILATASSVELLHGMSTLVTSLTWSLATNAGVQPAKIVALLRELLYVHAEMEDV